MEITASSWRTSNPSHDSETLSDIRPKKVL